MEFNCSEQFGLDAELIIATPSTKKAVFANGSCERERERGSELSNS